MRAKLLARRKADDIANTHRRVAEIATNLVDPCSSSSGQQRLEQLARRVRARVIEAEGSN